MVVQEWETCFGEIFSIGYTSLVYVSLMDPKRSIREIKKDKDLAFHDLGLGTKNESLG